MTCSPLSLWGGGGPSVVTVRLTPARPLPPLRLHCRGGAQGSQPSPGTGPRSRAQGLVRAGGGRRCRAAGREAARSGHLCRRRASLDGARCRWPGTRWQDLASCTVCVYTCLCVSVLLYITSSELFIYLQQYDFWLYRWQRSKVLCMSQILPVYACSSIICTHNYDIIILSECQESWKAIIL